MGTRLTSILLLACTGTLLYGYHQKKSHRDTETDRLRAPFAQLAALLPANATIYVHCDPAYLETYMHIRYLMAPRTLLYAADTATDTTLFIWPATAPAAPGDHTLWYYTDNVYDYALTIRPR